MEDEGMNAKIINAVLKEADEYCEYCYESCNAVAKLVKKQTLEKVEKLIKLYLVDDASLDYTTEAQIEQFAIEFAKLKGIMEDSCWRKMKMPVLAKQNEMLFPEDCSDKVLVMSIADRDEGDGEARPLAFHIHLTEDWKIRKFDIEKFRKDGWRFKNCKIDAFTFLPDKALLDCHKAIYKEWVGEIVLARL